MILSLRTRLLGGIVIATAVLLMIFSGVVYGLTRKSMIAHFDASLLNTAHLLTAIIEDEGFKETPEDADRPAGRMLDFEIDVRMTPEFHHVNGGAYYQVWDAEGDVLLQSPSLGDHHLEIFSGESSDVVFQAVVLPDRHRGRAISYQFWPRADDELKAEEMSRQPRLTLVLAQRTDEMQEHLQFLVWVLAGATAGVVVLSAGIAAAVARIGLSPVHTLAGQIADIHEDHLIRFCPDDYPAELRPVCHCLNDAFGRIAASFQREKQFNANVAHELRTPLAGMQSILEVSLSRPRESAAYRAAFEDCRQIAVSMNKMIDTLLALSRLDAGQVSMQIEALSLNALVENAWRFFADAAHDKEIAFDNAVEPDAVCQSDKEHLGMILSNVLHNAVDYTPTGGRIWTTAQQIEGQLVVSVCNTGCRLTAEEVGHVFDFFWRKSTSRSEAGRHCGIGLSVAQKIAQTLGIQIDVAVSDGTFCLNLHFARPDQ